MRRKKTPDWITSLKILFETPHIPYNFHELLQEIFPKKIPTTFLGKPIKRMTGLQFEQFLQWFFERQGYQVTRMKMSHDKGIDLLLRKPGVLIAVQAKRRQKTCGLKCVQEVYAGLAYYKGTHALVITTSTFTKPAVEFANRLGVELWDWDRLCIELRNQHLSHLTV
jgi:HJR/Mrr/RecB family endonuclease